MSASPAPLLSVVADRLTEAERRPQACYVVRFIGYVRELDAACVGNDAVERDNAPVVSPRPDAGPFFTPAR